MITYQIGERVFTRAHGAGVIERCYPVAKRRRQALSTYAVRLPGRRYALIVYADDIRRAS